MAYLLILTGQRVDELVELSPTATLTVGSSAAAHVRLPDAEIAEIHCQIYPAERRFWLQDLGQGRTLHNLEQLSNEASGLSPHDVIVLGSTFLKFVTERPVMVGGDDHRAEEIQQLSRELSASRAEVSRADSTAETLRHEVEGSALAVQRLREALDGREREVEQIRKRSEALRLDAEQVQVENEGREAEARRELAELRGQFQQASRELEQTRAGGEGRATEIAQELALALSTLEATRAALESLGVQRPAPDLPRGGPEDLGALLDTAGLAPDLAKRVEASLLAHTDREALRRLSAPALVFERPDEGQEIRDELRALRVRASDLAAALTLGRASVPRAAGES